MASIGVDIMIHQALLLEAATRSRWLDNTSWVAGLVPVC